MKRKPDSNRRDFLTAGWSIGGDSGSSDETLPRGTEPNISHLESYCRNAMACQFELLFNMRQYPNAAEASLEAFDLIEELEEQMSTYRDSSEVTFINQNAARAWIEIDTRLVELFATAHRIHQLTAGAFDMTSGTLSDLWGFSRRDGKVPAEELIEATLTTVGQQYLEIQGHRIRFQRDGVKINLGAIGKGFALDQVANSFEAKGISDFIIHGGQSSVIARGDNLTGKGETGWNVGLSHPTIPNKRLAEIRLNNLALGTSGTGRQGFFHQGKRYGHIIDPRTGYPTDHNLSTTVICSTAARADALATAFFVMDIEQIQEICDEDKSLMAIVVTSQSESNMPMIVTFNMDDSVLKTAST